MEDGDEDIYGDLGVLKKSDPNSPPRDPRRGAPRPQPQPPAPGQDSTAAPPAFARTPAAPYLGLAPILDVATISPTASERAAAQRQKTQEQVEQAQPQVEGTPGPPPASAAAAATSSTSSATASATSSAPAAVVIARTVGQVQLPPSTATATATGASTIITTTTTSSASGSKLTAAGGSGKVAAAADVVAALAPVADHVDVVAATSTSTAANANGGQPVMQAIGLDFRYVNDILPAMRRFEKRKKRKREQEEQAPPEQAPETGAEAGSTLDDPEQSVDPSYAAKRRKLDVEDELTSRKEQAPAGESAPASGADAQGPQQAQHEDIKNDDEDKTEAEPMSEQEQVAAAPLPPPQGAEDAGSDNENGDRDDGSTYVVPDDEAEADANAVSDYDDFAKNDQKYTGPMRLNLSATLSNPLRLSEFLPRVAAKGSGKGAKKGGYGFSFRERVHDVRLAAPPAIPEGGGRGECCVIVANLLSTTSAAVVRRKASEFGAPRHIRFLEQPKSGISFGVVVIEYTTTEAARSALSAPATHFRLGKEQPMVKSVSEEEYALMAPPAAVSASSTSSLPSPIPWLFGGPCSLELRTQLETRLFGRELTVGAQRSHEQMVEQVRTARKEKNAALMLKEHHNLFWQGGGGGAGGPQGQGRGGGGGYRDHHGGHGHHGRGYHGDRHQWNASGGEPSRSIVSSDLRNLVNKNRTRSPTKPDGTPRNGNANPSNGNKNADHLHPGAQPPRPAAADPETAVWRPPAVATSSAGVNSTTTTVKIAASSTTSQQTAVNLVPNQNHQQQLQHQQRPVVIVQHHALAHAHVGQTAPNSHPQYNVQQQHYNAQVNQPPAHQNYVLPGTGGGGPYKGGGPPPGGGGNKGRRGQGPDLAALRDLVNRRQK